MRENIVFVYRLSDTYCYPEIAPFHPDQHYPEYQFSLGSERNVVYGAVRNCLYLAGLDKDHYGTPEWNPLKALIHPGETVLLKPNLIKERHPRDPKGWQYVLTHGSVIRAIADYVWKALDGQGRIIVADAPQTDSSFSEIVRVLGLDIIRDFYRLHGLDFELIDLRRQEWLSWKEIVFSRRQLPGDPNGYLAFDLGKYSEFNGHLGAGHYYGADYETNEVNRHHSDGRHEYLIAASAIKCDVIFNLPKLKTHKKTGVTISLKNLVGITGDKNWLPHHTEGDPSIGGDERPKCEVTFRIERSIVSLLRRIALRFKLLGPWLFLIARHVGIKLFGDTEKVIRSGNWWGNDTVWRMCLDLNKIAFYGNHDATMREGNPKNRKRHYVLVDGIIAGEGHGPIDPDPVPAGMLAFGVNPASVDAACAYLIGYDPERIPIIRQAFRCQHYSLAEWDWRDVQVISNQPEWNGLLTHIPNEATFHFEPHFGWKGHIERKVPMYGDFRE